MTEFTLLMAWGVLVLAVVLAIWLLARLRLVRWRRSMQRFDFGHWVGDFGEYDGWVESAPPGSRMVQVREMTTDQSIDIDRNELFPQ